MLSGPGLWSQALTLRLRRMINHGRPTLVVFLSFLCLKVDQCQGKDVHVDEPF
jgi:hypothetical protein